MAFRLFDHQKKGLELLADHDSFGLFWDMGSGKTLTMLMHLSDLVLGGEAESILWLAPKSALGAVERDCETLVKCGLSYRAQALEKALTLMNYEKLSRKDSKHRKEVDETHWDAIVMDEAHCLARPSSNRTKYVVGSGRTKGLIANIRFRYVMTGTPVTNSRLEDFWSFMMIMCGGNYYTYPSFEREYLKTRFLPGTYVKIIEGYRNQEKLLDEVSGYSQSILKSECMDLPECMPDNVVTVPWVTGSNKSTGMSTKAMYDDAMQENVIEYTEEVFDNPLVRTLRLRQIAAGHVVGSDGSPVSLKCAKIDYAMELIESNPNKTVVFYNFKHSFTALCAAFKKAKVPFMYLNGNQQNKNVWRDFQAADASECRVFLAQYQSANAGIDLFTASDTIYYEPCNSSTMLDQSRSRTHRNGVSRACTFTFLLTEGSIEEDMYRSLQAHEDFNDRLWLELKRKEGIEE